MMKRILLIISFVAIIAIANVQTANSQTNFSTGEVIKYKVHYGFINAVEGEMTIDKEIKYMNGKPCYAIEVKGRSVGMFDLFLRIRDTFGTYIDTTDLVPMQFYRVIEEGKYRKHEIVDFNRDSSMATVRNYHFNDQYWKPEETFEMAPDAQDLISAYYFLRTLDFDQFTKDEIITLKIFFDDEMYDFQIRYLGKEQVKTKLGKYNAIVLSPIMPDNKLFKGENSIRAWISDDEDKIPLKVKAKMFVGAVEVDILDYSSGK